MEKIPFLKRLYGGRIKRGPTGRTIAFFLKRNAIIVSGFIEEGSGSGSRNTKDSLYRL